MLPSLGFNEIIILGILALIVVGPKDLPLLFRKIGRWTAKLRGMAQEFRTGFDELARNELTKPLPTLEDYAGVKSKPPIPSPPAAETPALEAPVEPVADVEAEKAADEEATDAADAREPAKAAQIARSAP